LLNVGRIATRLAPEDAEIAFNLAAVLEAVGRLDDALVLTLPVEAVRQLIIS
jgi:thioredoxin-like negative regulator of GroEL